MLLVVLAVEVVVPAAAMCGSGEEAFLEGNEEMKGAKIDEAMSGCFEGFWYVEALEF